MTGFDYISNIQPNAQLYDYRVLALSAMPNILDASMFQQVLYVVPSGVTLSAGGSHLANIYMRPNTIIYGIRALVVDNPYTFKVYQDLAYPVMDSFVRPSFGQDGWLAGTNRKGLPFQLLNQPVPLPDGRITVEISNPSLTQTCTPQVILVCAEPVAAMHDLAGRFC